jgi:hypothetical protein
LHNVFFDTLDLKSTLGPIIGEVLMPLHVLYENN